MQTFFLESLVDHPEAKQFFNICCATWLGLTKMDRVVNPHYELSESEILLFLNGVKELKKNRPVQYVVGSTWFYNQEFLVEEGVLIPRPETEELVDWVVSEETAKKSFVDVGTGSGCIPLSIKKHIPAAKVVGLDISQEALAIAEKNAQQLHLSVEFREVDILDEQSWGEEKYEVVISNPPYIPESDKEKMHENVLAFEPKIALFVPNNSPLLFYEKIADFAFARLAINGILYFEIHEDFGNQTLEMLVSKGFSNLELRKDLQGKDRMVRAVKSN